MAGSHVPLYAAGQRVEDRYFLEELIGRGGSAEVYRARDEKSGQYVALKRALSGAERGARSESDARTAAAGAGGPGTPVARGHRAGRHSLHLEREYHTLAQLAHPRIIEVYEYGLTSAGAFYTMELLDGDDLAQAGRMPWTAACALLVDVASSLSILHSRGLLHRDLSARNVRLGRDSRAKLIDFGALASIGVALEVVGTPPYVPPEALQMQVLDARADLFGLGALAYFLLTGRHAFAARKLSDLRDVWRSSPTPLTRLVPEAPPALSSMIMQLLSLDRMARPPSAADVMRRLCAIASLPVAEDVAVSRAYLTTPVLIGRERLQTEERRALLRLTHSQGATLLIEGPAGSGRTRALDACCLDGRLLGTHVARVDAGNVAGDFAVARSLCAQLYASLPGPAAAAVRPLGPWLGPMVAELRGDAVAIHAPQPLPERNALIRGLRDFVLALGERDRLLLAVDDADCIDEPSLAFLAALAGHADTRSVVLSLTLDVASRKHPNISLQLLRAQGQLVELLPLTAAQTEALLRSVFGDMVHVPLLSGRVHALARGNPRDTMELAQHLVQRGLARYEAGAWSLPREISEHDLPHNMAASLHARVTELPADARALAELTAVTELPSMTAEQYARLCPMWDHARVYAALQELQAQRMLLCAAHHYTWSQRGLALSLCEAMSGERLREVHARWADALTASDGDPLLRVRHLFEAGRYEASIALLLSVDLRARHPHVPLLERVLEQALRLKLPRRTERELRLALLNATVFTLDVPHFAQWGPRALHDLVVESGLAQYGQLAHVPESERLASAVALTQQRFLSTPEHERGFDVNEAVARLAQLANAYGVMALWSLDESLLADLPPLEPLMPLSPMIVIMCELLRAARLCVTGRIALAIVAYEALLKRLRREDGAGLSRGQQKNAHRLCHMLLGLLKATNGFRDTEVHARVLEASASSRANAWHIRQVYHMSQGNQLEAGSCGRQADLLKLQQGAEQVVSARTEAMLLFTSVRMGDARAMRAALEQLAPLAERYRGWQAMQWYGQAELAALEGDFAAALTLAERGLASMQAGQHTCFSLIAAVRVHALVGLGRAEEAARDALAYSAELARADVGPMPLLAAAAAKALSALGRHAEAFQQIERAATETSELGMTGTVTGYLFETAAYVAVDARDGLRFELWFAACALEYKKGHNPLLGARLARLFDAAQKRQLRVIQLAGLLDESGLHVTMGAEQVLLRDRFGECTDRADRAHCALSLVLSQGERASGYLFAVAGTGLVLLGGIPSDHAPRELHEWIAAWYAHSPPAKPAEQATETLEEISQTETEISVTETDLTFDDSDDAQPARLLTVAGREYEPIPLLFAHEDHGGKSLVGVFVLEVGRGTRVMPTRTLLSRIAELLNGYGDLPITDS